MSRHVVLLKYNMSGLSEYLYILVSALNIGNVYTCCITKFNTSDQSEYLYRLVATLNIGNDLTCCITKVEHVWSVRVLV